MTSSHHKRTLSNGSAEYTVVASAKRPAAVHDLVQKGESSKSANASAQTIATVPDPPKKLAPLFSRSKKSDDAQSGETSKSGSSLVWKAPLGPDQSCLRGEYGSPFAIALEKKKSGSQPGPVKIACFDLDGCLIKPKGGKRFPSGTDAYDYEQAFRGTFARVRKDYEDGACIVIITNQDQSSQRGTNSKRLTTWKQKMANIAEAVDTPFIVFAALNRDGFRKPGRLMWDHGLVKSFEEAGGRASDLLVERDGPQQLNAFFVGDAAGRPGDHSDTDRKWALNLGMPFFTPEEYFLEQEAKAYKLSGWQPTLDVPTDGSRDLPHDFFSSLDGKLDIVVFVGPPGSGKTSFFRRHLAARGYEHINQDTLKTALRCVSAAREALKDGHSVVIDNTNRNATTRAPYIALAREFGGAVKVRCVYFTANQELCAHNNFYRVRAGLQRPDEPRALLPGIAISSFFANLEVPSRAEGFDAEIAKIAWSFVGDDEAKRRWLMRWD